MISEAKLADNVWDGNIKENGTVVLSSTTTTEYSSKIKPAQGFFISTTAATYTPKFKVDYTTAKVDIVNTKSMAEPKQSMVFKSIANNTERKALALQNSLSSDGFDVNDSYVMFSTEREDYVEPYFVVDGRWLYANEFASLPYTGAINFHASAVSDVKFTVSNVPNDIAVYMVDLTTGQQTLISDGSAFEFTAQEGENEGRYAVKFVSLKSAITETAEANVNIWNADRSVNISGEQIKNIEVLNVLGQSIYNANVNAQEHHFDLNAQGGTYIIKVATAKGEKVQKITLK